MASTAAKLFLFLTAILVSCDIIGTLTRKEEYDNFVARQRRSLVELNSMVSSITGKDGTDFLGYGHWCGLGGSSQPVDAIDECCEIHDMCYDLATRMPCRNQGKKVVYNVSYKWKTGENGNAICEESGDECTDSVCLCDSILVNCLRKNLSAYDPKKLNKVDFDQLMEQAKWIADY